MRRRSDSRSLFDGQAPPELLDMHHSVWSKPVTAAAWMAAQQLDSSVAEMKALSGPLSRHHKASEAWAIREGMVSVSENGYSRVDQVQQRAAGIPTHGGARILEQLKAAGVAVERG